jgi:sulfate adenylyltransferase subunit 1
MLLSAFLCNGSKKFHDLNVTTQGRRVFWGRVGTGTVSVGQTVTVFPSGQTAVVAQALSATRAAAPSSISGHSAGIALYKELMSHVVTGYQQAAHVASTA